MTFHPPPKSIIKNSSLHLPATTKCPQQQRKEASLLTQREGEEEGANGEEIGEQP